LKTLADKLGPIIMNNLSWHTKEVNDVKFNEFDHVKYFYLSQGNSFSLFREVIGYT